MALETYNVTITNDNKLPQTSITTTRPHNTTDSTIPNLRPGCRHHQKSSNIHIHSAYGDSPHVQDKSDIRIFFQNVKGLTYSHSGKDYDYDMMSTQAIDADIIGMARTNSMAISPPPSITCFMGKKHFGAANVSFGYPDATINRVPDKETFQSGGSTTMTTGILAPMSHGGHITDPTGLGRWNGHTLQGKSNKFLSVFPAYRACSGSFGALPIGSTFSCEHEHLR